MAYKSMHLQIGVKGLLGRMCQFMLVSWIKTQRCLPHFISKQMADIFTVSYFSKAVFDRDRDKQRKEDRGMWENMARRLSFSSDFISFS